MAVAQITNKQLLDNYAVVQLLTDADPLAVGDSFTVAGVGAPFDGTFTVWALPQFLFLGTDDEGDLTYNYEAPLSNQVLYKAVGSDVQRTAATGTFTYATGTCTWVTATQIEDWLGIGTASALDQAFLTQCAAAANSFAFRRRAENGYQDSLSTSPNAAVTLGTIAYGGFLYRQRGSITDFAGFDGMATGGSTGVSPMIKQLLGIDRAQVY
jgi:hypothetical protein